ncbi:MAG: hypothetical protein WC796_05940 [Candidatus Pacearchaeota archaeon]|jgi:hypothetical protein
MISKRTPIKLTTILGISCLVTLGIWGYKIDRANGFVRAGTNEEIQTKVRQAADSKRYGGNANGRAEQSELIRAYEDMGLNYWDYEGSMKPRSPSRKDMLHYLATHPLD